MGVRFAQLVLYEVCIPFRVRYRHALADRREARSLILAVTTEEGVTGYGEAIPRSYLTGEDLDSVRSDMLTWLWPAIAGLEISSYTELLPALAPLYHEADRRRRTGAYAGFELALIDAAGKTFKEAARVLIPSEVKAHSSPSSLVYTGPIGGGGLRTIRRLAKLFRLAGFRDIKLKLGFEDDLERLKVVRQAAGRGVDLRVDANAGWSLDAALRCSETLRLNGVSSIEQPLVADDLSGMARLQKEGGIPIMADESLCTCEDADRLIQAGACEIFNLRLAKCGGYSGCLALLAKARAAGLSTQLGVLVGETSILAGAEEEFLKGTGPHRHHETSFPRFFLRGDPARGASGVFFGGRAIPRRPRGGFGITVTPRRLEKITRALWRA